MYIPHTLPLHFSSTEYLLGAVLLELLPKNTNIAHTHNCSSPTVILFWVSVPVLSEQMTDVLPRVSTASSFLTKQFFIFIC